MSMRRILLLLGAILMQVAPSSPSYIPNRKAMPRPLHFLIRGIRFGASHFENGVQPGRLEHDARACWSGVGRLEPGGGMRGRIPVLMLRGGKGQDDWTTSTPEDHDLDRLSRGSSLDEERGKGEDRRSEKGDESAGGGARRTHDGLSQESSPLSEQSTGLGVHQVVFRSVLQNMTCYLVSFHLFAPLTCPPLPLK